MPSDPSSASDSAGDPRKFPVVNPETQRTLRELTATSESELVAAVTRARAAQTAWQQFSVASRARALRQFVRRLAADTALIDTLVAESGKPRYEAEAFELLYLVELTRYLCSRRGRLPLQEVRGRPSILPHRRTRVRWEPLGVIGVIGPFNWPILNNFADCVAPLLAGNAVLLKPSPLTPLCSLTIAERWRSAGMPDGLFQVLCGGAQVGARLLESIDGVLFTGSAAVGRQVARSCAERLIPCVLELGGHGVMIVRADADLAGAARAAVWGACANSGQVCVRIGRVVVHASVADRFVTELQRTVSALELGPLHQAHQVDRARELVRDAIERGARLVSGGKSEARSANRFIPTLVDHVSSSMRLAREECLAPVLAILRAADDEQAIAIANDPPAGLAASVWSEDLRAARRIGEQLTSGTVSINDVLTHYLAVESPLAGVHGSGLGYRHGPEAIRQFCRPRTILEPAWPFGWLGKWGLRRLAFPYRDSTLRALRWVMRWRA
jgi:acyl-CoA reductase-like NAD-dependent aldehyde dehydrogenase